MSITLYNLLVAAPCRLMDYIIIYGLSVYILLIQKFPHNRPLILIMYVYENAFDVIVIV